MRSLAEHQEASRISLNAEKADAGERNSQSSSCLAASGAPPSRRLNAAQENMPALRVAVYLADDGRQDAGATVGAACMEG